MFGKAIDFYHCKQKKTQLYSEISTCNIFLKKYGCRYTKNIEQGNTDKSK